MSAHDWSSGSRLKLRHLQLVAAIGDLGNLGAAARHLNITQPAASRLLAEIEGFVGVPIFDRLPRGLDPNLYGEVFVRRAQIILAALRETGDKLEALRSGLSGRVTLGIVSEPAVDFAAELLAELLKTNPSLSVTVEVAPSVPIIEKVLDGKIDLAIARLPAQLDTRSLDYREISDEKVALIVRSDHRLAGSVGVRLADIADDNWAMEPPNTMQRRAIDAAFRSAGVSPPTRVLNTSSLIFITAAVRRGNIIGAVPNSVTNLLMNSSDYRVLDMDDREGGITVEPYGLIRSNEKPSSPATIFVYDRIVDFLGSRLNGATRR